MLINLSSFWKKPAVKRASVLGMLLAVSTVSIAVKAFQAPAADIPIVPEKFALKTEKLRDNLYLLLGGGGNTAVFIGTKGVVLVDTKNPGGGQAILDELKKLTDKPVTTIINSHSHYDHTSGNVDFPPSVEIIAHVNAEANMKAMRPATGNPARPNVFKANPGKGLPKRTVKDRLTVGSGPDQIDMYFFGRGHTNTDIWTVFPAIRAMHSGDIFGRGLPLLDANNGGSGVEIADALAKAHSTIKNIDSIIPGHGTVQTMDDLKLYAEFNREFLETVRAAKKAGKTVDEATSSWTLAEKYVGYGKPQPARVKQNVQIIYDELK